MEDDQAYHQSACRDSDRAAKHEGMSVRPGEKFSSDLLHMKEVKEGIPLGYVKVNKGPGAHKRVDKGGELVLACDQRSLPAPELLQL